MCSRKVLVSWRDSNKIIQLDDEDDVPDFETKIRGCFSLDRSTNIIIQRFEKEWETFVDINDNTKIEHMDKFKCMYVAPVPLSIDDTEVLDDFLDQSRPFSILNVSPASGNTDSSTGLSGSSIESSPSSSSSGSNQWPFDYKLPTVAFSKRLQNTLETGNSMNWSLKHEFIQCITDSIVKITLYPSTSQLQEVASKIVHTYPHLRETMGNGYEGWKQSIRNSLKNFRRKSEEPIVKCKKRKCVKLAPSDVNISSDEAKTPDKSSNITPTSSPSSIDSCKVVYHHLKEGTNWAPKVQDNVDLEAAVKELKEEMKETVKDRVKINAMMEKTFPYRREFINTCPPVTDIMDMFPALQDKDEAFYEFQRLVQTVRKECYDRNLTTYRDSVLGIVRNLKKKSDFHTLALQHPESDLAPIMSLPGLFGEEESVLFKVFPAHTERDSISEETGLSPMLSIVGDFWSPAATVYICCERKILLNVETEFAVLMLIGFFYILNIKYPRKGRNTFSFIESVLVDIPAGNCPAKVISLVEKLKKQQKDVGATSSGNPV